MQSKVERNLSYQLIETKAARTFAFLSHWPGSSFLIHELGSDDGSSGRELENRPPISEPGMRLIDFPMRSDR